MDGMERRVVICGCVGGGGGGGGRCSSALRGSSTQWATAHGNATTQIVDGLRAEVWEQQKQSNDPRNNQHNPQDANYWAPLTHKRHIPPHPAQPGTPTTGLRERGNDTSRSTGRSGRQNAATRRNMRREERVTVQGPVKKQQPDGMSHRG